MYKWVYYTMSLVCFALCAVIITQTVILFRAERYAILLDENFLDYYFVKFKIPAKKRGFDGGAGLAYLPVYSINDEETLYYYLTLLSMEDAHIVEYDEYFEAFTKSKTLRLYRYIDLLEYESGVNFASYGVFGKVKTIKLTPYLSGLANFAHPLIITFDALGAVRRMEYYFFDYEAIGAAQIIPVELALNLLPRQHKGKINLLGYKLVYGFEDSILQPMYLFYGFDEQTNHFEYFVRALNYQCESGVSSSAAKHNSPHP